MKLGKGIKGGNSKKMVVAAEDSTPPPNMDNLVEKVKKLLDEFTKEQTDGLLVGGGDDMLHVQKCREYIVSQKSMWIAFGEKTFEAGRQSERESNQGEIDMLNRKLTEKLGHNHGTCIDKFDEEVKMAKAEGRREAFKEVEKCLFPSKGIEAGVIRREHWQALKKRVKH